MKDSISTGVAVAFMAAVPLVVQAGDEPSSAGGSWSYRTQLVLDGKSDRLTRMRLRVWDPHPDLRLEFYWEPTTGETLPADGTVNGWGTLTWREAGTPRYDRQGVFSTYRGRVQKGRPDGFGRLKRRDGLTYEGEWARGRFHGRGEVTFPDGDQYDGHFTEGQPHGQGRYAHSEGEIYIGGFRKGKRHGRGMVIGPDGQRVASIWSDGVSGDVRSTQWNPFRDQDARVNLRRVSVGVMPVANQGLTYEVANRAIRIGPSKPAARLLAGQDTITNYDEAPDGHSLIKLKIRVANKNPDPVYVSGLYLDVAESVQDNRPVLIIGGPDGCDGSQHDGAMRVRNIGWSPLTNVRFSLAFADQRGKRVSAWFTKAASKVGPRFQEFRFADALAEMGANTQGLIKSHKCRAGQSKKACLQSVIATGHLGRLAPIAEREKYGWVRVPVLGRVSYNWRDAAGDQKSGDLSYRLFMNLQYTYFKDLAECGGFVPYDPQAKRPPQGFRLGQKNYRMNGNLRRNVRVGKARDFTFNVKAQKTSLHRFRAVVEFADGSKKRSPWVTLSFFNPMK